MAADSTIPILAIGGGVVLVGGIVYAAWAVEKRRTAAMQAVAQRMGFSYEEMAGEAVRVALAGGLPVFDKGHSKRLKRVLRGKLEGRTACICDYSYTTGGGRSRHVHNQTILVLDDARGLPDFTLGPENFFHRIASALGYQDIDFEQHPDFSKHYLLRGPDEAAIRSAFTTDVLSLLGQTTDWHVESSGGHLAIYRSKFADPEQLPSYAAEAMRIAGTLSRRVPS